MNKKFLILGGYGNAGRLIAKGLLTETNVQLIIAGRHGEKASQYANTLNQQFPGQRVTAVQLDAANMEELREALQRIDLVIVASSTVALAQNVIQVALDVGIDYFDIQLSNPSKWQVLQRLQAEIKQAGRCFITDGGFHPGLVATLIRYATTQMERVETAKVAGAIRVDWKTLSYSKDSLQEFVNELKNYQPLVWQQDRWTNVGWRPQTFEFDSPIGKQACVAMFLEELRELPEVIPSLQATGFFVAGFHWFIDYLIMPLGLLLLKFSPKITAPFAKLFGWSLNRFASTPPFVTMLLLEARGWKDGKPVNLRVTLSHPDAYFLTAAPVIACLLQYLEGRLQTGVGCQANRVEPVRMLQDIERLGVTVKLCAIPLV